jgi:hypothetical protein
MSPHIIFLWADDQVGTASIEDRLQRATNNLTTEAAKCHVTVSPSKTKAMAFEASDALSTKISVSSKVVPFKYLESSLGLIDKLHNF